jgi:hypothetical protein
MMKKKEKKEELETTMQLCCVIAYATVLGTSTGRV